MIGQAKTRGERMAGYNLDSGFLLSYDWVPALKMLSGDEVKTLILALVDRQRDNIPLPKFESELLNTFAQMIEPTIKRRLDGHAGGVKASESKSNEVSTPVSTSVSTVDTTSDTVVGSRVNKSKEKYISPPIPPSRGDGDGQSAISALIDDAALSDTVKAKLREWLAYKGKSAYKFTGTKALISRVCKAVEAHGDAAVCDVIDESIANAYKGIVWDKLDRARPQTPVRDSGFSTFDTEEFFNLAVKRGERMGTG